MKVDIECIAVFAGAKWNASGSAEVPCIDQAKLVERYCALLRQLAAGGSVVAQAVGIA